MGTTCALTIDSFASLFGVSTSYFIDLLDKKRYNFPISRVITSDLIVTIKKITKAVI